MTGDARRASDSSTDVHGTDLDPQTRCVHWHSELDVVAIEFECCRRFYACRTCHDVSADHPATTWPQSEFDRPAVLCGVCRIRFPIADYLAGGDICPACSAPFNPGCRLHHHLYFDDGHDSAPAVTPREHRRPDAAYHRE